MALNKVMLIGNVGRDPEVRYLEGNSQNGSQSKVANFTLATSERYRDRSGELRENTEWHNIVVFRPGLTDVVEKYVRKGMQVFIEGSLRTRQWTDQSGNKRYTTEIVTDNMQLLTRRSDAPEAGGYAAAPAAAPRQAYSAAPAQQPAYRPAAPAQQPAQDSVPAGFAPQQQVDFTSEPYDDLPF